MPIIMKSFVEAVMMLKHIASYEKFLLGGYVLGRAIHITLRS